GQIDLRNLITDSSGYNTLSSGKYKLLIKAEGAGLSRANQLFLTLTNNTPATRDTNVQDQPLRYVVVDDPEKPETLQTQQITIDFRELVTDPDNDRLRFQLTPVGDAETILPLTIDADTGVAEGMTIKNMATGMFRYGDAKYTLTVLDDDTAQQPTTFTFTINVISTASQIIDRYQSVTTSTGIDSASGTAAKNSQVVFSMHLNDVQTGAPDTTGEIRNYTGKAVVYDAANTSTMLASLDMTLNENGTERTATYTTPNTSGDFVVYFTYVYTGYTTSKVNDSLTFKVPNTPPTVVQSTLDALPETVLFDPGIFASLEQPTPPEALTLRLNKLFTDQDNEAGLLYADPVFGVVEDDAKDLMDFTRSGNTVQFVPLNAGQVKLVLSATDGDRKAVAATRTLTIVSIRAKWNGRFLLLFILLAALIITILLIRQHRKPFFPAGAELHVFSRFSVVPVDKNTLTHTKRKVPISSVLLTAVFPDSSLLQGCLSHIDIKPSTNAENSIFVYHDQRDKTCVVTLKDVKVRSKGSEWQMNEDLVITTPTGEMWRIVLIRDSVYPGMGTPYGDGFYADDGFSPSAGSDGGKHPGGFDSFSSFSDNDVPPSF
ncbi:MAG: hypothetical protein LLF96_07595, partial [Eubacteriales bacterium]|nr:hypothetical protein [Eubacteriales bacterium]